MMTFVKMVSPQAFLLCFLPLLKGAHSAESFGGHGTNRATPVQTNFNNVNMILPYPFSGYTRPHTIDTKVQESLTNFGLSHADHNSFFAENKTLPDSSVHFRLGMINAITGDSCNAVGAPVVHRALYDVNSGNATFCPAIGKLQHVGNLDANPDNIKLGIEFFDMASTPTGSLKAAQKLMGVSESWNGLLPEIHGIIGSAYSSSSMAVSPFFQGFKKPMVCFSSTSADLSNKDRYPQFYRTIPSDSELARALVKFFEFFGWRKGVVIMPNDAWQIGLGKGVSTEAAALGMDFVWNNKCILPTWTDGAASDAYKLAAQECLKWIHAQPDGGRVIWTAGNALAVWDEARKLGLFAPGENYIWFSGSNSGGTYEQQHGTMQITAKFASDRFKDLFVPEWEHMAVTENFDAFLDNPICGEDQNVRCNGTGVSAYFSAARYGSAIGDCFPSSFAYDAAVFWSIAIDLAIKKGIIAKADVKANTVSATLWNDALQLLLKDATTGQATAEALAYGECLSNGPLVVNSLHDRDGSFLIRNFNPDCATRDKGCVVAEVDKFASNPIWVPGEAEKILMSSDDNSTMRGYQSYPTGLPPVCGEGEFRTAGDPTSSTAFASSCQQARPGYYVNAIGALVETACPAGTNTTRPGTHLKCTACPPGYEAPQAGSVTCTICGAGTFADAPSTGASTCALCQAGSFSLAGAAKCTVCPVGQYSSVAAATTCQNCPSGMTTLSVESTNSSDCVCMAGLYMSSVSQTCQACPVGLSCPAGSAASNLGSTLVVKEGFYLSSAMEPFEAYQCDVLGEARLSIDSDYESPCTGGGASRCRHGYSGLACGRCIPGYFKTTKLECEKCGPADGAYGVLIPLLFFFAPVVLCLDGKQLKMQSTPWELVPLSAGVAISALQSTIVVNSVASPFNTGISLRFEALANIPFLKLSPKSMRPECLYGDSDVTREVATMVTLPYLTLLGLGIMHKLTIRVFPDETHWLHMSTGKAFNAFGLYIQAIFIALCLGYLDPLRCISHPNGKQTMVTHPHEYCWEGAHAGAVAFCMIGMLPLFFFILLYFIVTRHAPMLSIEEPAAAFKFLKFMFNRFNARVWWWGVPFLIRSLILSFVTVIDGTKPFLQLGLIFVTIMVYVVMQAMFMPWKHPWINRISLLYDLCLLVITFSATGFVPSSSAKEYGREFGIYGFAFAFTLCIVLLLFGITLAVSYGLMYLAKRSAQEAEPDLKSEVDDSTFQGTLRLAQKKRNADLAMKLSWICDRFSQTYGRNVREENHEALIEQMSNVCDDDLQRLDEVMLFIFVELLPLEDTDWVVGELSNRPFWENRVCANWTNASRHGRKNYLNKLSPSVSPTGSTDQVGDLPRASGGDFSFQQLSTLNIRSAAELKNRLTKTPMRKSFSTNFGQSLNLGRTNENLGDENEQNLRNLIMQDNAIAKSRGLSSTALTGTTKSHTPITPHARTPVGVTPQLSKEESKARSKITAIIPEENAALDVVPPQNTRENQSGEQIGVPVATPFRDDVVNNTEQIVNVEDEQIIRQNPEVAPGAPTAPTAVLPGSIDGNKNI